MLLDSQTKITEKTHKMLIKYAKDKTTYITSDGSEIYEALNPKNDPVDIPYSIAIARVEPFASTKEHFLLHTEIYYILKGRGKITVGDDSSEVVEGDTILIPPRKNQFIENKTSKSLEFLAIVSPPWCNEIDFLTIQGSL